MKETKIPTTIQMAFVLSQHRLAIALKFSVITLAVVALYFQDLSMVFTGALTDESTYHILAIPFLFAYLIYRKRKMINAALQPPQTGARGFQKYFSTFFCCFLSIRKNEPSKKPRFKKNSCHR